MPQLVPVSSCHHLLSSRHAAASPRGCPRCLGAIRDPGPPSARPPRAEAPAGFCSFGVLLSRPCLPVCGEGDAAGCSGGMVGASPGCPN